MYVNTISNIPTEELYDKNGNPYVQGYNKNGNKLDEVIKQNELNYPGEEIYEKNGNQLTSKYHKVFESGVQNENV